jgi:hypothetical protein
LGGKLREREKIDLKIPPSESRNRQMFREADNNPTLCFFTGIL